jgi:hypothetical protein
MIKKLLHSKNILIIIILVIIIFEIFVLVSNKQNSVSNSNLPLSPSPNPTISITNNSSTLTPIPKNSNVDNISSYVRPTLTSDQQQILDLNYEAPLGRLLPYQGKYFLAKRYVDVNELEIIVKNRDETDLAKKEAQEWLVKNGVDQDDHIIVSYFY